MKKEVYKNEKGESIEIIRELNLDDMDEGYLEETLKLEKLETEDKDDG